MLSATDLTTTAASHSNYLMWYLAITTYVPTSYLTYANMSVVKTRLSLYFNISCYSHTDNEIEVFYIKSWNICTYSVYFKSKKELNYNRFVDPNILGASRLVHSDLRIYRISFFLLDIMSRV